MNQDDLNGLKADLDDALAALGRVKSGIDRMYNDLDPGDGQRWLAYPLPIAYPVTSEFGDGGIQIRPTRHEGTDFGTPIGVSVLASAPGSVVSAQFNSAYGYRVRIEHEHAGEKWWTWYCHLQVIMMMTGQNISAGQVVGLSGATGNVTGPHLHFNVQRESDRTLFDGLPDALRGCVNPREWVVWKE